MRSIRSVALAALVLASCARDLDVELAPVVQAGPDLELPARSKILLGATARSSSAIQHFDWTVVSTPPGTTATLGTLTHTGDVAELRTQAVPGLYVVCVTATNEKDLTSTPDFVNITLTATPVDRTLTVTCDGCRAGVAGLEADEASSLTFKAVPKGFAPAGIRWALSMTPDPADPLKVGMPNLSISGDTAAVTLSRVGLDAHLTVSATAYGDGGDLETALNITVRNTLDEPPVAALEWHVPGGKSGDPVTVLPGDALYVNLVASDPNGDAITCSGTFSGSGMQILDPATLCRFTVIPTASGKLVLQGTATAKGALTHADPVVIDVAPFRVANVTGGANAIALDTKGKNGVATGGGKAYLTFDTSTKPFALTNVPATFNGADAAAFSDVGPALIGFAATPTFGAYDFQLGKAASDLPWTSAIAATGTVAMSSGSDGRVWAAMTKGIGLYDPNVNGPLEYWPGAQIAPVAIAWGPTSDPTSSSGYVWYAEGQTVYCQTSEDPTTWSATTRGPEVGKAEHLRITALATGPFAVPDLWVGTGPTGAALTGFGVSLYQEASNPPRMNNPQELFAQVSGGIASVAVEQSGPYQGDAWLVAGEALVRVSRVALQEGGPRGVTEIALVNLLAPGAKAAAVAVNGRRVAVATDQGVAVAP